MLPARVGTRNSVQRVAVLLAAGVTLTPLVAFAQSPAQGQPAPYRSGSGASHGRGTAAMPFAAASKAKTAAPATGIAVLPSSSAQSAAALPRDVRLFQVRRSLLGRHVWYRQMRGRHPVVGGWYARHYNLEGQLVGVYDGRRTVRRPRLAEPQISAMSAEAAATPEAPSLGSPELMVLPPAEGRDESRLVWAVVSFDDEGALTSYVDAETGDVVEQARSSKQARPNSGRSADSDSHGGSASAAPKRARLVTGRGRVFDPNPVVALQNPSLRDRRDKATPALSRAYAAVDLPRLRPNRGLAGRWVRIMNSNRATSDTDRYFYSRADDRFEQVVAYYAIDAAQAYLQQLGFRSANAHSQAVITNRFQDDNSFFEPSRDVISFGSGGVDDAEDVEIVWHEYGHAIQDDQVPDFGLSPQAGAIGEGFGDYFAVTMSAPSSKGTGMPLPCVADWDAVTYDLRPPHCLRRIDRQLRYADRNLDIHRDGGIWSRALWDIHRSLPSNDPVATPPRDMANRIIVEAHYWMHPRISMPRAARVTIRVARSLYGAKAANVVRDAFETRGILARP